MSGIAIWNKAAGNRTYLAMTGESRRGRHICTHDFESSSIVLTFRIYLDYYMFSIGWILVTVKFIEDGSSLKQTRERLRPFYWQFPPDILSSNFILASFLVTSDWFSREWLRRGKRSTWTQVQSSRSCNVCTEFTSFWIIVNTRAFLFHLCGKMFVVKGVPPDCRTCLYLKELFLKLNCCICRGEWSVAYTLAEVLLLLHFDIRHDVRWRLTQIASLNK